MSSVPAVRGHQAPRCVPVAIDSRRQRAHRHGRVHRTEGRGTDLGNGSTCLLRQQRHCAQIAGLALVDRHARGRIALHVLDGREILARGEFDIRRSYVVAKVDPLTITRSTRRAAQSTNTQGSPEVAVGRADHLQRGGTTMRHETGLCVVVAELAAGLRVQVNGRAPAPGYGQRVTADGPRCAGQRPAVTRQPSYLNLAHTARARRVDDHGIADHLEPTRCSLARQLRRGHRPRIDDGRHTDTCGVQRERRAVGIIIVGRHDDRASDTHRVLDEIASHRAGQHDPGSVVVGEHQWLLDRTGGNHHPFRPDLPQPLDGSRRIIGLRPIHGHQHVVVVVACDQCAGEHPHIDCVTKFSDSTLQPLQRRHAVHFAALIAQAATESRFEFGDDYARAFATGGEGLVQARRPTPNDQHVAMQVVLEVLACVLACRQPSGTRRAPDQALVPVPTRPLEGLVVEPRWPEPVGKIEHPPAIESDAGPGIFGGRGQTLDQRLHRRPHQRHREHAGVDSEQRVGLLHSRGQNSARAVILEAATDDAHAVREQCRSQRIASVAREPLTIAGKGQRPVTLDESAGFQTVSLRPVHAASPLTFGFGSPMR